MGYRSIGPCVLFSEQILHFLLPTAMIFRHLEGYTSITSAGADAISQPQAVITKRESPYLTEGLIIYVFLLGSSFLQV